MSSFHKAHFELEYVEIQIFIYFQSQKEII